MSDQDAPERRWKDDADAPARLRAVLGTLSAAPKRMPDDVRAAVLGALPGPPAPAPAPPKPFVATPIAVGAGAFAIAVVAAAVWLATRAPAPAPVPAPSGPPALAPAPSATPMPSAVEVPSTTPSAAATPDTRPDTRPDIRPATTTTAPRTASSVGPSSLAEETALVGRARSTLATDPDATLAVVAEHARKFPRGDLASERDYLRISALRRLGRDAEAKVYAKAYVATYPSSPQAATVRRFLSETP